MLMSFLSFVMQTTLAFGAIGMATGFTVFAPYLWKKGLLRYRGSVVALLLDLLDIVLLGGVLSFAMVAEGFGALRNIIIGLRGGVTYAVVPEFGDDPFGKKYARFIHNSITTNMLQADRRETPLVQRLLSFAVAAHVYVKQQYARALGNVIRTFLAETANGMGNMPHFRHVAERDLNKAERLAEASERAAQEAASVAALAGGFEDEAEGGEEDDVIPDGMVLE